MGKQQFDYRVSLRVTHPTLDPGAIANELGLQASHSWAAGEARETPEGTPLSGVRKECYCTFDIASGDDGEVAGRLRAALSQFKPQRDFLRQISSSGGSLMSYVFWYPAGDTGEVFSVALLHEMADLGIELGINVYDDCQSG